jgi:hypothetical protein
VETAVIPTKYVQCVISGFRREVAGNCAPLGYYSASSGNFYSLCNNIEERSFQVHKTMQSPLFRMLTLDRQKWNRCYSPQSPQHKSVYRDHRVYQISMD